MTDDNQIDFSPLIARHTDHFVGRTWLRAEIDRFIADSGPSTLLVLATYVIRRHFGQATSR